MSESDKKIREADSRMLVQLSVEELRNIVSEIVEQKLKARLVNGRASGLLNAEQAAEFLGYSKIGSIKIGRRSAAKGSEAKGCVSTRQSFRLGLSCEKAVDNLFRYGYIKYQHESTGIETSAKGYELVSAKIRRAAANHAKYGRQVGKGEQTITHITELAIRYLLLMEKQRKGKKRK